VDAGGYDSADVYFLPAKLPWCWHHREDEGEKLFGLDAAFSDHHANYCRVHRVYNATARRNQKITAPYVSVTCGRILKSYEGMTMPDDPSLFAPDNDFWGAMVTFVPLFIFSLMGSFGVGIIAKTKRKTFWGWVLLSLIVTPVISGIVVMILEPYPVDRKVPPTM
jgi:hypothetical protein